MRSKPANMKYTDLCIYIDKTLYNRDKDNNPISVRDLTPEEIDNVYTYLYHITYALAVKKRLFTNEHDYDAFCIDSASRFYQRFTNPNQIALTESNTKGRPYVKSVLNYIKGALGFMAVTFRKDYYAQTINAEHNSSDEVEGAKMWIENEINAQFIGQIRDDIIDSFSCIPYYLDKIIDNSIYSKSKLKRYNLEMSIILSLLNCICLEGKLSTKTDKRKYFLKLKNLQEREQYSLSWIENCDSTPQIIELYTKKLFKIIEKDISEIKNSYVLDQNIMDEIIKSSLPTYGLDQSED